MVCLAVLKYFNTVLNNSIWIYFIIQIVVFACVLCIKLKKREDTAQGYRMTIFKKKLLDSFENIIGNANIAFLNTGSLAK